jgi:hypothetical protein
MTITQDEIKEFRSERLLFSTPEEFSAFLQWRRVRALERSEEDRANQLAASIATSSEYGSRYEVTGSVVMTAGEDGKPVPMFRSRDGSLFDNPMDRLLHDSSPEPQPVFREISPVRTGDYRSDYQNPMAQGLAGNNGEALRSCPPGIINVGFRDYEVDRSARAPNMFEPGGRFQPAPGVVPGFVRPIISGTRQHHLDPKDMTCFDCGATEFEIRNRLATVCDAGDVDRMRRSVAERLQHADNLSSAVPSEQEALDLRREFP